MGDQDRIEKGVANLGKDAKPRTDWEARTWARIRRRRFFAGAYWVVMAVGLVGALVMLVMEIHAQESFPAPSLQDITNARTAAISPLSHLVPTYDPPPELRALAMLLDCSGGQRRVISWVGDLRERGELLGFVPRPERSAELWLVLIDPEAAVAGIGDWEKTPWYVPREWSGHVAKHLHLTIGAGCVLGNHLGTSAVLP